MEWERNDRDKLGDDGDDEMASHKRRSTPIDLREHQGKTAEDLLKITKKGETLLMFVNIRDPSSPEKKCRLFTEKYTDLWRSMLRNNHVVSEVYSLTACLISNAPIKRGPKAAFWFLETQIDSRNFLQGRPFLRCQFEQV
ncbi:unnamed protein product [Angiostrongylus costaricensis]|uniref:DUF1336 domain-containing protein n=1 Tax=Angiostrongylus costaricensis TaxID=334426 RepID=A0A0R3Q0L3_ANGCS|nr:unnamed protein product [Angiostrongylus costaricensis]